VFDSRKGRTMKINRRSAMLIWLLVGGTIMTMSMMSCAGGNASRGAVEFSNGAAQKTFIEPLPRVSAATLRALDRMGMEIESRDITEKQEVIRGTADGTQIEVWLEAATPKSTRMTAVAKKLLLRDQEKAMEIVLQTEKFFQRGRWG
jgi:Protein of unknown function (DUF3568)